MQRLRRTSECLHATLPADYPKAIAILRKLAPRINSGFVTLVLPDYVGLYGRDDFDTSMEALKFFTAFGSSEFAIREFIRQDPARTLAVMKHGPKTGANMCGAWPAKAAALACPGLSGSMR
jgi:3-methyladenine DNA glycosylase AlkC